MFYIKECYLKIIYIIFSTFCTLVILFINKELIIILLSFSILKNFENLNQNLFETFIYNSPVELLTTYFSFIIYCSINLLLPYFLWNFYDFFKSALYNSKLKLIKFIIFFCCFIIIIILLLSFLIFLPKLWFFFQKLNTLIEYSNFFNFYGQLQFSQYFLFLKTFINTITVCYFFIVLLIFFSFLKKLNTLMYFRKFFIFLNMCLATILSPPDLFSQLFFFILFFIISELLTYFFITLIKYEKFKQEKN